MSRVLQERIYVEKWMCTNTAIIAHTRAKIMSAWWIGFVSVIKTSLNIPLMFAISNTLEFPSDAVPSDHN